MPDRLLAVHANELGSGLSPSEPGRAAPFWKQGRNVVFNDGHVASELGQSIMFFTQQQEPITGIKSTNIDGVPVVFFGTLTSLYRWDEVNGVVDLTRVDGLSAKVPYTGTVHNPWQWARWGSWMVASNGVDPVQVYKNTGKFVALAAPFTFAKLLYSLDTHLLVLNTSDGDNIVKWSDLDNIEEWATTVSNDAGEKSMRNLDSGIISVEKLGDTIVAYTNNEAFAVNYIGRPYVFGTQFLMEGFGPAGINSVAVVDKRHFGFGRASVWVTDGLSVNYIQSPAMFDFLYRDQATRYDKERPELVLGFHDRIKSSVCFYYATEDSDSQNIGVAFNYKTLAWTVLAYGRTAVDDSGVFPFCLAGDSLGNIYQQSIEDAPPATSGATAVNLTSTQYTITTAIGEGGIGEGGIGGYDNGTG